MIRPDAATILVVDDNPPTRYSTGRVLRSAEFEVVEAGTGGDALKKSLTSPDLIILDVNLPDIDGFEVCRRIRANPLTARTPVIHLSATFITADAKVRGFDAGADGYLTHPVEPPVLIATVNAFLRARRAEDAMGVSEAKFRAVFENAVNGIALLSEGMIYLDVNPAAARTFGITPDSIVGKHISSFLPSEHESVLAAIDDGLARHGAWRGAFPALHADGSLVELEWNVSLHTAGVATRLAITTDISEQKAIEAERERLLASERAARAEAERANQLKDEFLAAVSHELRTPLNTILGWANLLRLQPGSPDRLRALEAIERNVATQSQMIADLMDVSLITTGKLRLHLESFDPGPVLEAAMRTFAEVIAAKHVTVDTRVDDVGELVWDLVRFQQVVTNLLGNALKFSDRDDHISVVVSRDGETTVLEVQDSGKGIALDFLPHVFDRFRQEDAGTRRRHGGLGLGLAIVKQLVEAHAGTIAVHSEGQGKGATFTVRMPPLAPAGPVSEGNTQASAGDHRSLAGVRILVVDDDSDAVDLVSRVLSEFDAAVLGVNDVASARTQLHEFRPDVVVSDISMPGEDGYDLIRFMRRPDSEWARIPAIALTAFARLEDRDRLLAAGYQRHVTKPIDTLKLVDVVLTVIR